jgi:hypothetical protein
MGAPIDQAKRLADRLLAIPQQRVIDIKLYGSEQAADQLARIRQEVTSIPQEWRTTYYVNQVNSISRRYTPGNIPGADGSGHGADGATVPKTGLPYADRHLYMLADGEEVISNRYGQADRHRELLKAINGNRLAGGGTVGRHYGGGTRTIERHVIERLPDRLILQAGGERFEAYVERIADDRIDAADMMTAQVERAR